jgi:Tol biopolymer transport system component
MAQHFDEKRLETMGDAVPIADPVGSTWFSSLFTASANGILIHRPPAVYQPTWIDHNGQELSTVGEPSDYLTFDLSKDGDRLVVSKYQLDGYMNLWAMNLLRGNSRPLTLEEATYLDPRWSPDGRHVIFGSTQDSSNALFEVSLPSSSPKEVFKMEDASCYLDDWSQDGKYLLYHQEMKSALWALPYEGDQKPILAARSLSGIIDQSQFSPNGRFIAYNTNESGRHEVWVVPFPPGNASDKWPISTAGGMQPRWSSDGRELYFLTPDAGFMAVNVHTDESFEYGEPEELFRVQLSPASGAEQYAPHPDGERFLFMMPAPSPFKMILNWTSLLEQ